MYHTAKRQYREQLVTMLKQSICRYKSFFGQIQDLMFLPDGLSFVSAAEVSRRNSTDKGIMVWDYKTSTVLPNQVFQVHAALHCTARTQCTIIHSSDNNYIIIINSIVHLY